MIYQIDNVDLEEYPEVVELWEASVRATHGFLSEKDIQFFKPLILNEYLKAVELNCVRSSKNQIMGFAGVAEGNLEMLFVHPDHTGKGIGKALLNHAIQHHNVTRVDVNEQNLKATEFYLTHGFRIVSRDELDGTGKPYPILHLEL